jgi:aldehyde:ferredoxin oxidoreductase
MSHEGIRVLHVDLSRGTHRVEELSEEMTRQFIGGRGIGAWLLWRATRAGGSALEPDNPLILSNGRLAGTPAPCSGRSTVTCRGASNDLYLKTSGGGSWGVELKWAGYDHLLITGASPEPVYLWIDDDRVEIREAGDLWGLEVLAANDRLRERLGDREIQLATIGPAGENRVRFAAIMFSYHHAAARGGAGAVMGSKKLKAIAVRGSGAVAPADPQRYYDLCTRLYRDMAHNRGVAGLGRYGTSGGVPASNEEYIFAAHNFKRGQFEGFESLSGQHLVSAGYLKGRIACFACPIACHRYTGVEQGPYAGVHGVGPEYETMSALGAGCGLADTEAVIRANQVCNEMGMDTISAGGVVQWAMECYERGVIDTSQADGLDLAWGNGEAVIGLLDRIARRQGIGDILAEGVRSAAEELGHDSYQWAVQVKGLEQSRVDTRAAKGYALAFAVNPRGADHLFAQPIAEFAESREAVEVIARVTGDASLANALLTEKRAEIVRWHEDAYAAVDSLGLCLFAVLNTYAVRPQDMVDLLALLTGVRLSQEELMRAGRRILTLERSFNAREGLTREDDVLPWRLMNEPIAEGPFAGETNSREELEGMKDEYYRLHGWDLKTGNPTESVLQELGLAELIHKT